MMLKIGNRVRFVNEKLEGVITSIEGKRAGVTTADGFEIPAMLTELVRIEEPVKEPVENTKAPLPQSKLVKVYSGVHIAFERITDALLDLKLHNSEADSIQFAFYHKSQSEYKLFQTGDVEHEKHISLGRYNMEEVQRLPVFVFHINFVFHQATALKNPLVAELNLSAKNFHRSFGHCYFLGKQAYTFRLDNEISKVDLQKLKQADFSKRSADDTVKEILKTTDSDIIDLHIEKLTDDPASYSAQQILDLQLKHAQAFVDGSTARGHKRIIIIHGVGNSFLRKKVQDMLRKHPNVLNFNAADMLKFGDGATEIWMK